MVEPIGQRNVLIRPLPQSSSLLVSQEYMQDSARIVVMSCCIFLPSMSMPDTIC